MKRFILLCVAVALLAPATADATFPGANGKIAFVRDGDIWTMNPDGTGQVNLTNSAAVESNPAWSPDGNRIAFDSNASVQRHLYVMLADGSAVTQVTSQQPCCNYARDPAWSPDGNKLVYHRFDYGLATINIDGTDDAPIYQATTPYGGEGVVDPEWSPDGDSIAFQGEGAGNCWYGIATIDPDGSGFAPASNCPDFMANRYPSWSPDAARIAFTSDEHCGGLCGPLLLSAFDPDGANRVTFAGVEAYQAAWSPDGTKIAYADQAERLNVVDSDGTGSVDLTDGTLPDWQPLNAGGTQADVLATLTDSPDPVAAGGILTYTAQAKNLVGPEDASAVTLTLNLPAGVFFVSATPTQGSCSQAAGIVSCNLGNVPEGTSATVTVQVEPQNPLVTLNASATVGAAEADPVPGNNSASASTTVTYGAYARPKGATPSRFPLVPAYRPCEAAQATLTHGPPLAHPSCGSPALASGHLTVGTPDANGAPANSAGFVKLTAIHEPPPLNPGNGDQNDVGYDVSLTDVRNAAGLTDYAGELRVQLPLRLTDRDNSPSANAPATMSDTTIEFDVPCSATANPNAGSTCAVSTTAEALLPGPREGAKARALAARQAARARRRIGRRPGHRAEHPVRGAGVVRALTALAAPPGATLHWPMRALLRTHWPIALVLLAAAAVRAGVAIAYWPAVFFGDSWAYLNLAFEGGFAPDRPSGYPLLIDLLSTFGRDLGTITVAQHVAGLVTTVLVYALMLRLRLPRWLAAAGAAVVGLDAYAIALEQQVLAEAFFTLALVASFFCVVGRDRGPASLAAGGVLLALAATMRTAALFAVPVWIAYVLWSHRALRLAVPAIVGLAIPLLAYSTWHAADTGRFGLTQAGGWFLYGRVGEIADCAGADIPREARPLCVRNERDRREGAAYHIWNADGPARRVFGAMSRDPDVQERSNRILRDFAVAIIRDRPGRYADLVWDDFMRYFDSDAVSRGNSDLAVQLPQFGRIVGLNEVSRDRWFPGFVPHVRPPAKRMRDYHEVAHTPRPLMGLLALAAAAALLVSLGAALMRRAPLPRRREVFLLSGAALAMLLGTAATSEFVLRYLIPVVPLLVCGGAAACADLASAAIRAARRVPEGGAEPALR